MQILQKSISRAELTSHAQNTFDKMYAPMNHPNQFWLFFLLTLALACQNQQPVTEYVDMDAVQVQEPQANFIPLDEDIVPTDIFYAGETLFIVNRNRQNGALYSHEGGSSVRYGRGPGEVVDFQLIKNSVQSHQLKAVTNHSGLSSYEIQSGTATLQDNIPMKNQAVNRPAMLSNDEVIYQVLGEKQPFEIFNAKKKQTRPVGVFPDWADNWSQDDRDNLTYAFPLPGKQSDSLFVFYTSLPWFEIQSLSQGKVLKRIQFRSAHKHVTTPEAYYNGEDYVYYMDPIYWNGHIFVLYFDQPSASEPSYTYLVEIGPQGEVCACRRIPYGCIRFSISPSGQFAGLVQGEEGFGIASFSL